MYKIPASTCTYNNKIKPSQMDKKEFSTNIFEFQNKVAHFKCDLENDPKAGQCKKFTQDLGSNPAKEERNFVPVS